MQASSDEMRNENDTAFLVYGVDRLYSDSVLFLCLCMICHIVFHCIDKYITLSTLDIMKTHKTGFNVSKHSLQDKPNNLADDADVAYPTLQHSIIERPDDP